MNTPLTLIHPLISIQRERLLPLPGQILVRKDQKVSALDVVAETNFSKKHALINISRLLRISPGEADSLINCQAGDRLAVNQVIAPARGFFSRPVLSPFNGLVILVGEGQVLMEAGDTRYTLLANYPGTVSRIIQDKGVEITSEGTVIQGIWGNGQISSGRLQTLSGSDSPGDVLTLEQLDNHLRGSILMAGHCNDQRVLKKAVELPLGGLILGSISSGLLSFASRSKIPIMVTDGFGHHPMNSRVFELLSNNVNQEVALISNIFHSFSGSRPEIVMSLPLSRKPPLALESEILSAGSQVRIVRNPGLNKIGTVSKMLPGKIRLPSGLDAQSVEVRLNNGKKEVIPLANLELIS